VRLPGGFNLMYATEAQRCYICKTEKPASEFHKHSGRPRGIRAECKLCTGKEHSRWSSQNPERKKELFKAWRTAHLDECRERLRRWQASNPEKVSVNNRNRRALVRGAAGIFSLAELDAMRLEQDGLCFYCTSPMLGRETVDHKTPVSRGGTNWAWNIVLACQSCNSKKKDKTIEEFLGV
jgi:5-methylcytosine-specific restriction endonuclease McrA